MATAAGTVGGDPGAGTGSGSPTPDRPAPATPRWRGPSGRSIGHTMTVPFSWELPYAWPRKPVLARNVVCTSQPLAAQAGLAMLADGGSAVDAALAAAITLTLVEPVSNGIGSDAFAIVWDGERLHGLNASGRSPAAWTPEYFHGGPVPPRGLELGDRAGRGVGMGRVARAVRQTAVRAALRTGDPLRHARDSSSRRRWPAQWAGQARELRSQPGFAEAFLPGGRAPAPGERFQLPEHAATLERIAATGGEAFYRGELAATMEAHSTANGGAMLAADLSAHRVDWVDPISIDYRGYTLHEIPPNGQGIVALMALGILEHFDMASLPVDSADSVHLQIEAIKLGLRRRTGLRRRHRPHAGAVRADLLDPDYLVAARGADRPGEGEAGVGRPAAEGRHGVSHGGRRRRDDGVDDPVQLRRLRVGRRGAGHRESHCRTAAPGSARRRGTPICVGPRKRPYHTIVPGFLTEERRTGDELRCDGRHACSRRGMCRWWCGSPTTARTRRRRAMVRGSAGCTACR